MFFGILFFAVANSLSFNLQSYCRNDGAPGLVAVANVASTAVNIFLDWLFVFPLQKGVMGAAIATGISQVVGLLVVSTHFILKKGELRIKKFSLQKKLFSKISLRGLPEAIAQLSTPITTYCMNIVLAKYYGDLGLNAFAVITYLSSFTMSVFFGASQGIQPLFGHAYGEKNDDDLKCFFRSGQLISIVGSAVCVAVYVLFPHSLCKLFGADLATIEFAEIHIWEYCWGFVIGSVNTMLSAYFYSTKRSAHAIALNVARSVVFNSVVIILTPMIFGAGVIWHTFGIYEIMVLILGVVLKRTSEKNGVVYR